MQICRETEYIAGSLGVDVSTWGWWDSIERMIPSRDFNVTLREKQSGRLLTEKSFCNCRAGKEEAHYWVLKQAKDFGGWR